MDEIGPVDYAVLVFPGSEFKGEIAPALRDLVDSGTIRLIDAAFVSKDEIGDVFAFELTELAPEVQAALDALKVEVQGLFNDAELLSLAEGIEPGSSAAVLVWENVWARGIASAVRNAGGMLLVQERVPHEIVQAAREWAVQEANA
jgi:hypothetical protein